MVLSSLILYHSKCIHLLRDYLDLKNVAIQLELKAVWSNCGHSQIMLLWEQSEPVFGPSAFFQMSFLTVCCLSPLVACLGNCLFFTLPWMWKYLSSSGVLPSIQPAFKVPKSSSNTWFMLFLAFSVLDFNVSLRVLFQDSSLSWSNIRDWQFWKH